MAGKTFSFESMPGVLSRFVDFATPGDRAKAASALDSPLRSLEEFISRFVVTYDNDDGDLSVPGSLSVGGLQWDTFDPGTFGLTVGSGTQEAEYTRIGDLIFWRYLFTYGSGSAVSGEVRMDLPVDAVDTDFAANGDVVFNDSSGSIYYGDVTRFSSSAVRLRTTNVVGSYVASLNIGPTIPFTWASGDTINAAGWYRAA